MARHEGLPINRQPPGGSLWSLSLRLNQALLLNELEEIVEAELPISIGVRFLDHLFHLLIRHLLPQVVHHVLQLARRDAPALIAVEDEEGLAHLLDRVRVLQL